MIAELPNPPGKRQVLKTFAREGRLPAAVAFSSAVTAFAAQSETKWMRRVVAPLAAAATVYLGKRSVYEKARRIIEGVDFGMRLEAEYPGMYDDLHKLHPQTGPVQREHGLGEKA